jgi:hypothetical protein
VEVKVHMASYTESFKSVHNSSKYVFFTFWAVGAILGGAIFTVMSAKEAFNAFSSKSWPTADISGIGQKVANQSKPSQRRVWFSYTVEGKKYESETVWFGEIGPIGDSTEIAFMVEEYKGNKVSYNPDSPTTAVLFPGFSGATIKTLGFSLLFLVMGVLVYRNRDAISEGRWWKS